MTITETVTLLGSAGGIAVLAAMALARPCSTSRVRLIAITSTHRR